MPADQKRNQSRLHWFLVQELRRIGKDTKMMKNENVGKCAHIPCLCNVPDGQNYCGENCRLAGSEEVEIACQCDHPPCPLIA